MARLRQTQYHNDVLVEEAELTEEQLKLYKENEDEFWEKYGDDLDWDHVNAYQKFDSEDFELIEDEEE
jgi:hypothetical protein